MQAALDLADAGIKVYLAEKKPSIGGVMAQLDKTFPTNDCAMCTMAPRLVAVGRHKDIEIITLADVEKIEGEPGSFNVVLTKKPRFIREDKCTGCGSCIENCPVRNVIYPEPEEEEIPLSAEQLEVARKVIERYEGQQGALVPVMQDLNSEYKYLPAEVLRYISQQMGYPLSQIYRLATFYNAFSLVPKGENIIRICLGTACYVKGGAKLLKAFSRELNVEVGGTTEDLKFSLETVNCLGCCGQSPAVVVNDDIYGYVTQSRVRELIERYE